jgi:hypothetical protein
MRSTASRRASRSRAPTAVELAIWFSLGGCLFAVAVPAFFRELHASRFAEPVEGLQRIAAGAVAYGQAHPVAEAFPASASLTPPSPPRGRCEVDPPGTWDGATWRALAFRPGPEGARHCFAFAFDSALDPARSTFRAHAHGDLDGDGATSTFEMTGQYAARDPAGPTVNPGMFVDAEVE